MFPALFSCQIDGVILVMTALSDAIAHKIPDRYIVFENILERRVGFFRFWPYEAIKGIIIESDYDCTFALLRKTMVKRNQNFAISPISRIKQGFVNLLDSLATLVSGELLDVLQNKRLGLFAFQDTNSFPNKISASVRQAFPVPNDAEGLAREPGKKKMS